MCTGADKRPLNSPQTAQKAKAMILRTESSRHLLDELVKAGLFSVSFLNDDKPSRELLYQSLIERIIDQAMMESVIVYSGDIPVLPVDLTCEKGDIEECPECGHCEVSDGYGGNDCPECNEAMRVRVSH